MTTPFPVPASHAPGARLFCLVVIGLFATAACAGGRDGAPVRFSVTVPSSVRAEPLTGRVFVFISRDSSPEPRAAAGGASGSAPPPFFGVDVSALTAGKPAEINDTTLGYPPHSLRDIPAGDYYVQALANVYTEFPRSDGHTIWAHMDQWEGQHFTRSPGNLVSDSASRASGPGGRLRRAPRAHSRATRTHAAGGYQVGQAHQDSERCADQVLGPPDVHRRHRAAPQGLRRAPDCALSGALCAGTLWPQPAARFHDRQHARASTGQGGNRRL